MNLLSELRTRLDAALSPLVDDRAELLDMVRPSQDAKFGDYQANFAMPLGKRLSRPPRDVAADVVARLLVDGLRKSDVVARIGGDEFAVLLGHADKDQADETASRLIELIAGCDLIHDGNPLPLSVAIGATPIQPDDTSESAMARADREMYRVKVAA